MSARLRLAIAAAQPGEVEFLPISILDHKGSIVADDYFVMNVLEVVDCFDAKASEARVNPISPDRFMEPNRICLIEGSVPAQVNVFRLKGLTSITLARRSFAESLVAQGFTGLNFKSPEAYTS